MAIEPTPDTLLRLQTEINVTAKEPDGFVCAGCGRNVFSMKLAPYCLRCRLKRRP